MEETHERFVVGPVVVADEAFERGVALTRTCRGALDEAELRQGRDSFRSDRIVYDRVRSVVKAGAAAQGKQRVRISIQPTN